MKDEVKIVIPSRSQNEGFARVTVGAFVSRLDPTLEELNDIKTAVSEAVTNCIVHAYPEGIGLIAMRCRILKDNILDIVIKLALQHSQEYLLKEKITLSAMVIKTKNANEVKLKKEEEQEEEFGVEEEENEEEDDDIFGDDNWSDIF